MRPLEITVPSLLGIYLIWSHPRPLVIRFIPTLVLILLAIHFFIEGYRWQMIPIYVLTVILLISSLLKIQSPTDWKPLASYLTLVLLLLSTALPILLPVPIIPAPSGPYIVGTRIYELTDTSRKEQYSGKDEARRFMIQVWYPSEPSTSDQRAPWMEHAYIVAPAIATYIRMPSFFLDHLALVKVPAYKDSKVAQTNAGFPVILFSHGWNGFNAQNTGQALELASHGFVVIGVQHTYGAVITVFPDGTIARNNPSALGTDDMPNDEYEAIAYKLVNQWAGDLGYTLDFMELQNRATSSPFYQSLDFSRVGVFGHSTGGGAGIQFCGIDPRCKALFGEDPFMRPVTYEVIDAGVTQPSFFMFSQFWTDDVKSRNNELFHRFYPHAKDSLGVVFITGTKHYDFSDIPLLSPLAPQLGLKGPINGKRVTTIVKDYLLSFFEATLNGKPDSLFKNPSPYAEVKPRD
jgi:platelet-activating factor acetylhydrolase isoform II